MKFVSSTDANYRFRNLHLSQCPVSKCKFNFMATEIYNDVKISITVKSRAKPRYSAPLYNASLTVRPRNPRNRNYLRNCKQNHSVKRHPHYQPSANICGNTNAPLTITVKSDHLHSTLFPPVTQTTRRYIQPLKHCTPTSVLNKT
jgi:hypothetical protein